MYYIVNNYGKPDGDHLNVGIFACDDAWAITIAFTLHGKEYAYSESANDQYPIHEGEFWYKVFRQGFAEIAAQVKADYPVTDADAFRDHVCKQINPETFDLKNWCNLNAVHLAGEECEQ